MLLCNILWQGLGICFIAALIDILFLTEKIIHDLSEIWRYILSFSMTAIAIIIWVYAFRWVGPEKANYILFSIIFVLAYAVIFILGMWFSKRLDTRMYNQRLAEYKAKLKETKDTDES